MRQVHKVGGHILLLTVVRDCLESLPEMSLRVSPVLSIRLKIVLGGIVQCLGDDVVREVGKDLAKFRHWLCLETGFPFLLRQLLLAINRWQWGVQLKDLTLRKFCLCWLGDIEECSGT